MAVYVLKTAQLQKPNASKQSKNPAATLVRPFPVLPQLSLSTVAMVPAMPEPVKHSTPASQTVAHHQLVQFVVTTVAMVVKTAVHALVTAAAAHLLTVVAMASVAPPNHVAVALVTVARV